MTGENQKLWVMLVIIALVVGFAGGYFYSRTSATKVGEQCPSSESEEAANEQIIKEIQEKANPFSEVEEKANPFEDVYINPFAQ